MNVDKIAKELVIVAKELTGSHYSNPTKEYQKQNARICNVKVAATSNYFETNEVVKIAKKLDSVVKKDLSKMGLLVDSHQTNSWVYPSYDGVSIYVSYCCGTSLTDDVDSIMAAQGYSLNRNW